MTTNRSDVEFMLWHFEEQAYPFPRRITTFKSAANGKIRSGGQFPVNSIDEILSAYKRADHKECRINAYPFDVSEQLRIFPNIIFIEIDDHDESNLNKVKRRLKNKLITSHPTINDSGRGYHIIQPADCSALSNLTIPDWFIEAEQKGWIGFHNGLDSELQNFYCEYLGIKGKIADISHNPSVRSCLIRVPGSVNVKVDKEVNIVQSWDGARPPIDLILGDFFSDGLLKYNEQKKAENERLAKAAQGLAPLQMTDNYYDHYVPIILKTPLPDWREHMIALEIVPYLLTVKKLPEDQVYQISEDWLKTCEQLKPLAWDYSEIWKKIRYTRSRKRKPMGKARLLQEMFSKSPEAYHTLQQKLNSLKSISNMEKSGR